MRILDRASRVVIDTASRQAGSFRRALLVSASKKAAMTSSSSSLAAEVDATASIPKSSGNGARKTPTPVEDLIREKLTSTLHPTTLEIHNDSHLHAHHAAMADSTSPETHFRINIISDAFESKFQPARHRMVYTLLKEEMARTGGIHALQLKTLTPEEEEKKWRKNAGEVE